MKNDFWLRIAVSAVLAVICGLVIVLRGCKTRVDTEETVLYEAERTVGPTASSEAVIYVTGAVLKPGVYRVPTGARIVEVLEQAGGFSENADRVSVNLAEPVYDGMHVHFPENGETVLPERDGIININTADAEALTALSGIGTAKAEAIVRYRKEHGPFHSVEELLNVPGIGEALLDAIKDRIGV